MRKYRALAMMVIMISSVYDAPEANSEKPAYSPADALHRILARQAAAGAKPAFAAVIPSANETARYPAPTGIASWHPILNCCFDKVGSEENRPFFLGLGEKTDRFILKNPFCQLFGSGIYSFSDIL